MLLVIYTALGLTYSTPTFAYVYHLSQVVVHG